MMSEKANNLKERQRSGMSVAKATLRAATDERCDWRVKPISFLKGEVCGSYYKVLGMNRKEPFDKSSLKKAFRQVSLSVHPDKNPAAQADSAFKYLHTAFDCLADETCRSEYDRKLQQHEIDISLGRQQLRKRVADVAMTVLNRTYHGVTVAATYIYQFGLDLWSLANDWEVSLFGVETVPVGKIIITVLLATKGRLLLKLHGLAYLIVRINYEIHKSRGFSV